MQRTKEKNVVIINDVVKIHGKKNIEEQRKKTP